MGSQICVHESSIFWSFLGQARALAYISRLTHFLPSSDFIEPAKKAQIENELKFMYPNPLFFGLFLPILPALLQCSFASDETFVNNKVENSYKIRTKIKN